MSWWTKVKNKTRDGRRCGGESRRKGGQDKETEKKATRVRKQLWSLRAANVFS